MTYPSHPEVQFTQDSGGLTKKYSVKESEFQGYRQRVITGINTEMDVWTLSLEKAGLANAKILHDFLDARAGLPFYWTAPRETSPKLWTTDERSVSELGATYESASVTYTRWFGADDS